MAIRPELEFEMENRPVCEICGHDMLNFEVVISLGTFGYLICEKCMDEDE